MKSMESIKKFSIWKLLLTILCTTMISTFIGFTITFISVIPNWMYSEVLSVAETTEEGNMATKYWENLFENTMKEQQEEYNNSLTMGENYSVKGSVLINLVYGRPAYLIVKTFAMTCLIGTVLGTIIYIIVIQKVEGKRMIIQLIIAFVILIIVIILLNLVYRTSINRMINNFTSQPITYYAHIYDIESNEEYIVIQYIVVVAIIYIVNMIRKKILANKLNKELNNK